VLKGTTVSIAGFDHGWGPISAAAMSRSQVDGGRCLPVTPHPARQQASRRSRDTRLCSHRVVLVDEATKHVVSMDVERRGNAGQSPGGRRHAKVDASVGALLVVVTDVFPKHSSEVAMAHDEYPVEAFVAYRPHPAFGVGIGPRRSDWRLDHPNALGAEHLVEAGGELGVPIPDQELDGSSSVHQVTHQVAGHLGNEGTIRMISDTENVHFPSREFDDEEHVEPFERNGVHRKEVRGQHAVGLGAQELRPGGSTPRCRPQAMSAQDPPDRGGRDTNAELSKLALDADTSPVSVLSPEANDEPDQFVAHRWSARPPLLPPTAPLVLGRFPVPSQQGVGGHQEGPPPGSMKQSAERSEDGTIDWPIPDTCMELSFENLHLVPKHHDLDVLFRLGLTHGPNESKDAAGTVVKEREGHIG